MAKYVDCVGITTRKEYYSHCLVHMVMLTLHCAHLINDFWVGIPAGLLLEPSLLLSLPLSYRPASPRAAHAC